MAELVAGAAKKGKKTGAPEAPRFGRVRSNLKVRMLILCAWYTMDTTMIATLCIIVDGHPWSP